MTEFRTSFEVGINSSLLIKYFKSLVNSIFKILPMRETNEKSLMKYIRSLQIELAGCKEVVEAVKYDSRFLSIISILQYLYDHPETEIESFRREIFRAISICNKLSEKYATSEDTAK